MLPISEPKTFISTAPAAFVLDKSSSVGRSRYTCTPNLYGKLHRLACVAQGGVWLGGCFKGCPRTYPIEILHLPCQSARICASFFLRPITFLDRGLRNLDSVLFSASLRSRLRDQPRSLSPFARRPAHPRCRSSTPQEENATRSMSR